MSAMNFAETNMQTGEKRPPSGQAPAPSPSTAQLPTFRCVMSTTSTWSGRMPVTASASQQGLSRFKLDWKLKPYPRIYDELSGRLNGWFGRIRCPFVKGKPYPDASFPVTPYARQSAERVWLRTRFRSRRTRLLQAP